MEQIVKPIFIIGAPRSGTTFFYNVLSKHPEINYLSGPKPILDYLYNLSEKYKENKNIFHPLRYTWHLTDDFFVKHPCLTNSLCNFFNWNRVVSEGNILWSNIFKRFFNQHFNDVLEEGDVNKKRKKNLKSIFKSYSNCYHNRYKYILLKSPDCSVKIRFIKKIFPNAYFIHLIRDGRAVANSIYNRRKLHDISKWWGVRIKNWDIIEKNHKPIVAAGLQWKRINQYILNNKNYLEDNYIEIRYENFVNDFDKTLNQVLDFCNLDRNITMDIKPRNMNYKWKQQLTENQINCLLKNISDMLSKLEYI